ncbi:MAG: hypothetical protein KGL67_01500 [Patescibacteria group bacterium]|nr:hypothetical protein [Patescibacteria group bacterium]
MEKMPQKDEEKFKIKCANCSKEVEVALFPWSGGGYTAICPVCGKLAYNSKEKPRLNLIQDNIK